MYIGGDKMSKTIYIVLTETGSMLSRAIKMYTQDNFNHVSIALDPELTEMYSFGRKKENNPLIGGFVREDVHSKLLRDANCAIYAYTLSDEHYIQLRMELDYFKRYQHRFHYNFIGLVCLACGIRLKREYAFFCSQFVATLFLRANIADDLCPYFIRPIDFKKLPNLQLIYRGQLKKYIFIPRTKPMENIPVSAIVKTA